MTVTPDAPRPRPAARSSCGLAFALFLFSVMLGMMGIGSGISMLLFAGAVVFALLSGILYVLHR